MNYKKIYDQIIEKRRVNIPIGYFEKHHILPRSLGGDNSKSNIIKLTAREHFICHYLLTKIHKDAAYHKMNKAFMIMAVISNNQQRYINSILYESNKKRFSLTQQICQTGSGNSQFGKKWINKNGIAKSVSQKDLIHYLIDGWVDGRQPIIKYKNIVIKKNITKKKVDQTELTKQKKLKKLEQLYKYHKIYIEFGFDKFQEITNYQYSWQNLVMDFKRNIPEFVSANTGKKVRGI